MNRIRPGLLLFVTFCSATLALDAPSHSKLILEDDFERSETGKGWTVQNGDWKIVDGVLSARELEADNHAASSRRVIETEDATYELKFQLSEGTKAFHFGFDPKRGSLEKKGHLFSIVVTANDWRLLKHVDKNRPEEDPNEILARASHAFEPGKWYSLRVTTLGHSVEALIDGLEPLVGQHASFSVPKPTLVFRVVGETVLVDEIRVWAPQ